MTTIQGIVYVLTNTVNNKMYVGQTKTIKVIRGQEYVYGVNQRFMEHIGAARRGKTTPIAQAIGEYGPESFYIDEIERCNVNVLNEREAFYIKEFDTVIPNGYNVQKQSGHVIRDDCERVTLKGIKQNGELNYVRAYITYPTEMERSDFYGDSFADALQKARAHFSTLDPQLVTEHCSLLYAQDEPAPAWLPYKEKIEKFNGRTVTRIRVCSFGSQNSVRVQVKTADMRSWRDEEKERMVFGSKKIPLNESLAIAMSVVNRLEEIHNIQHLLDPKLLNIQRQQQVAAD